MEIQEADGDLQKVSLLFNLLCKMTIRQRVAVCCSVLQCVAAVRELCKTFIELTFKSSYQFSATMARLQRLRHWQCR